MDPNVVAQAQQQAQPQTVDPTQVLQANNTALLKKKQLADQEQNSSYAPAQISQAMAAIAPKSTAGKVGKAIASPAYAGLCLKWVDDQQGSTNRQPTAFADFQENAKQGKISGSDKIPDGARVYFAPDPSNDNMGHVGIANKDGTFTSATDNGIKTFSLKDWEKYTGQQFIGWSKSKN